MACLPRLEDLECFGLRAGGFDEAQLKSAYRQVSLRVHPDKKGAAADFIRITKAYKRLKTFLEASVPPLMHHEAKSLPRPPVSELKTMDPAKFNEMFEKCKRRDGAVDDGHGAWLASIPETDVPATVDFNKFHQTFRKCVRKKTLSLTVYQPLVVPSAGCSLCPTVASDSPTIESDYSSVPGMGREQSLAYSDLRLAHDQMHIDMKEAERFAAKKRPELRALLK